MKRRSVHFARQTLPQMMNTERRYIHDFLFCLNLALVLKLEGNQKPNKFFSFFESGESLLQSKINASLHLHPHHSFGANLAFLLLALVLALLLFVVLRVLLTSSFLKNVFHSTAGVISLIALPVGWLWVSRLIGIAAPLPNPPRWALYLELSAVAAYAVLYSVGRWVLPLWLTMTLFAVHFGYWDFLVSRGPYFWLDPFSLIFPFVGLLATIAWGWGLSLSKTSSPPNAKQLLWHPSFLWVGWQRHSMSPATEIEPRHYFGDHSLEGNLNRHESETDSTLSVISADGGWLYRHG